jgi:hypothetical protein
MPLNAHFSSPLSRISVRGLETNTVDRKHLGGMNHKSTTDHLHEAENFSINPKPLTLSITGVTFELEEKAHNQTAHFHSLSVI